MNSFFGRLREFFRGRYGVDALSRFLVILSAVFWVLCLFVRFTPLRILYAVFSVLNSGLYIFVLVRALSKDISARELENERYLQLRSRVIPKWERIKASFSDREHAFRNCPRCGGLLRLQKISGRHTARCPNCNATFKVFIMGGKRNRRSKK